MYKIGDVLEHRTVTRNGLHLLGIIDKQIDGDFFLRIQDSRIDAHHSRLVYRENQLDDDWRHVYVK